MKSILSLLLPLLILMISCKSKTVVTPIPEVIVEEQDLDTLSVVAPMPDNLKAPEDFKLPIYNPSYHQQNDLVHTKLDIRFNWEKEQVLGVATLRMQPHFYPTDQVTLDAKNFEFHSVKMEGMSSPLKYDYDGQQIKIDLGKAYKKGETYTLVIDYTASPSESGGSAAITSDKGLFFINADGSDPNKPKQIWTQGETENNSRWFPTIDKPNSRTSQELIMTVADKYVTLSNGTRISSNNNADGTRTDHWKMEQSHAPYLFMVAVGEFAVVSDTWKGKKVDYYVEPEYEPYARDIFKGTVEMLDFFSEKLDYPYPWDKYSQIIVRDYVSGAMENTSAVIFGDFIQLTKRELIDNTINEMIVAHELFHHWFGDLVTCESWANLTMNEGFADYSEYLWFEHKYGRDWADYHRQNSRQGYIGQVNQGGGHPLIHFGYDDKEDMFDAHSYNKGGLVLHMLRSYVGDEAFWASLHRYLKDNEYTAVEAHDLRLAFEEVTGQDLNWFFDQWYFSTGHPMLDIEQEYDAAAGQVKLTVEQTQDPDKGFPAIFVIPVKVDIYTGPGQVQTEQIRIDQRIQTFTFDVASAPKLVNFDADRTLLMEKQEEKSQEAYLFQYQNAPLFQDRNEALRMLQKENEAPTVQAIFQKALSDPFWSIRSLALKNVDMSNPTVAATVEKMATNDKHSSVRASALGMLAKSGESKYIEVAKTAIEKDQAYPVMAAGLSALLQLDEAAALALAEKMSSDKNLLGAVSDVYAAKPKAEYRQFFEDNWGEVDGYPAIGFFQNYTKILMELREDTDVKDALGKLEKISMDQTGTSPWKRFGATKSLNDLREFYRGGDETDLTRKALMEANVVAITDMIQRIKAAETNNQLKAIYNQF